MRARTRACARERICAYACAPAPPSLIVYGERSPCCFPPIPASRGRQGGTTSLRRKRFTTLRQPEMTVGAITSRRPHPSQYHAAEHCRGSTWPGSPAWHALQAQRQEAETGVGNGSVELGLRCDIPDSHAEGRDGGTALRGACEGRCRGQRHCVPEGHGRGGQRKQCRLAQHCAETQKSSGFTSRRNSAFNVDGFDGKSSFSYELKRTSMSKTNLCSGQTPWSLADDHFFWPCHTADICSLNTRRPNTTGPRPARCVRRMWGKPKSRLLPAAHDCVSLLLSPLPSVPRDVGRQSRLRRARARTGLPPRWSRPEPVARALPNHPGKAARRAAPTFATAVTT